MSDLFDLYLSIVHWFLDAALTVLEHMGLDGGYLHRFVTWLATEWDLYMAAELAAVVLLAWTALTGGAVAWMDRRVRARVQGRAGPRLVGSFGLLQGMADWLKLVLRRREGMPSAVPAGISATLALAALALLPLGPWARLADPDWGLVAVVALLALAPLPMAATAPVGRRHAELAEAVGIGVVLMLAAGSMMVVGGTASSSELVALQEDSGWGILLSPLGVLLILVVMTWESDRLARVRRTGTSPEAWPGTHKAVGLYAVSARYFALAVLGTVLFLGGWLGPVVDGAHWTLVKAFVLVSFTSSVAGALPIGRPADRARSLRTHWLPLATVNLVLIAAIMEVMA
ncbi:MAG: NADH-quinone oxidoreductase subunit H [Thermoplasmata archaeon]|nr:MAG: NADH-quinone oxidoreductase subunit H [Thermoplasmata archaeon]